MAAKSLIFEARMVKSRCLRKKSQTRWQMPARLYIQTIFNGT
jgi:hypothetical protein